MQCPFTISFPKCSCELFMSNDVLLANGQSHEKCNNKIIEYYCQRGDEYFHLFNILDLIIQSIKL